VVLAVALASFAPRLAAVEDRAFTGHAWMHTDVIYQIADGALIPEDSTLAGYRLSYPWGGHVYQAVLSRGLGTAPVENWIWTNLAWLLAVCALTAGAVGGLGGGAVARAAAAAAMLLAVNPVGWIGMEVSRPQEWEHLLPRGVTEIQSPWGDPRYTPWALKFLFFSQMPFGLGLLAGLLYVGPQVADGRGDAGRMAMVGLLLTSLGVLYPILLPAGAAVVGAAGVAPLLSGERSAAAWRRFAVLAGIGAAAGAIALVHMDFVTRDRIARAAVLSTPKLLVMKIVAGTVALSVLLAGTAAVARRCWAARRAATLVLGLAAAGCFATHAVLHIAYWMNEYKFIFAAAMCLAPFAGIAFEAMMERRRRAGAIAVLGVTTAVLAFPLAQASWFEEPWGIPPEIRPVHEVPEDRPRLDTSGFDLRLRERPELDALAAAIREGTPVDAVLVAARTDVHLPTLTQRSLYAPPPEERAQYGINRPADYLIVRVRGYPRRVLDERMETVQALYEGDEGERGQALAKMKELRRPLAIVLKDGANVGTEAWLSVRGSGRFVYRGGGHAVWLEDAGGRDGGRP